MSKATKRKKKPTTKKKARSVAHVVTKSAVEKVTLEPRTLAVVEREIADVESTLASLSFKLTDVLRRIRDEDIEVDVQVTDNKGERITKRKMNPALKLQREITATRGSLQRCLAALHLEEKALKEKRTNADGVNDLDALLNQDSK